MNKLNKILILLIIGIFFSLPLLQYFTSFWEIEELSGYVAEEEKPKFSTQSWFDNSFQSQFDKYFNQKFGFRSSLVRLHNQIAYSLFNKVNANSVIVGKDDYLFETNYIKSYLGDDYLGEAKIKATVKTIDSIYSILKEHHTEMLIIIAPGKGFYYPEYIPEEMLHDVSTTNYEGFINEFSKTNIPLIDFNSLFINMKDTSSIVLYPKTGIHWSQGIIPFVFDTIVKKSEAILNVDMPNVSYTYGNPTKSADQQDRDIERGMNLMFSMAVPNMSYPSISFEDDTALIKPKFISIADSFFWQLFYKGHMKKLYSDQQFWYYYKQVYGKNEEHQFVENFNVKKELFDTDLVILMSTESNLYKFPFGFTNALNPTKFTEKDIEVEIQNLVNYIKTDTIWLNDIKKKAKEKNISIDSMIYLDAQYMIEIENKN